MSMRGDEAGMERRTPTLAARITSWWIIDPLKAEWTAYWDLVTTAALLYTAIVTPVEVAFIGSPEPSEVYTNGLFLANRSIDAIFLFDMLCCFRLAVRVTGVDGTRWLRSPRDVARAYVCSKWFWLDSFSVGTSIFDFPIFGGDAGAKNLIVLRAVRVLRLFKLVRLARGSRILKRWEMRMSINYAYLSLANVMVFITIGCHWVACMWGLQASFAPLSSWYSMEFYTGTEPYCVAWADGVAQSTAEQMLANGSCPEGKQCAVGSCEDGVCHGGSACASPVVLYTTSLYYAICSVSGVGTMIAKPHNTVEQVSAGLIHLMTGMMWAYLIGVFTSLASNFSPTVAQFREDLSKLNSFMSSNNLPSETRFRLREYLHETVHLRDTDMQAALLQKLPPAMQDEVAWLVNEGWLQRVWYLRQIAKSSNRLLMRLASGLKPLIFMPGEMCPLGFLYFIKRGQVLYGGKVVSEGSAWGEDVLLDHPTLQLDFSAISTVYTWVLFMDGRMMVDTINQFPNEAAFINTVRKMWILRRAIVRAAERTCFANGKNFRGRFNPIYAKEITLQKTAKVRRATVLFSRNEGLMTRASSPCTPASNASKAALRRLSTAFVSKGRKGRRDKSPAGGSPRKSNNHFNVTDNSAERKAQMLAGNVATASASSVGTSVSDDRIQRLEDGFVRLESKLDQLLSASLGLPPPSQPLPLAAASTGSENHLASSLLSRWTESAETFKKVLQVPSREGSQKSHPPGGALEA